MFWREILVAPIRCEFKARYNYLTGWQLSARGALPVVLLGIFAVTAWLTVR